MQDNVPSEQSEDVSGTDGSNVQIPEESSLERTLLRSEHGRVLSAEGYGDVRVLSHEAADRVFTEKRREIVRVLNDTRVESQRDLADILDRDPGAVQRDLQKLREFDLVTVEDDGRAKVPTLAYDSIVVEPLAAPDSVVPNV